MSSTPAVQSLAVDEMIEAGIADRRRPPRETELLCDLCATRSLERHDCEQQRRAVTYRGTMYSAWLHGTLIRGTDMLFVATATRPAGRSWTQGRGASYRATVGVLAATLR